MKINKITIIRLILNIFIHILIAVLLLGFVFAVLYYIHGSYEMFPTEEQQEKAHIMAISLMLVTGIPCGICIAVRVRQMEKKRERKEPYSKL